jgi:hypothetical protein
MCFYYILDLFCHKISGLKTVPFLIYEFLNTGDLQKVTLTFDLQKSFHIRKCRGVKKKNFRQSPIAVALWELEIYSFLGQNRTWFPGKVINFSGVWQREKIARVVLIHPNVFQNDLTIAANWRECRQFSSKIWVAHANDPLDFFTNKNASNDWVHKKIALLPEKEAN